MVATPAHAPSDRRASLALRLAPVLTIAAFALVGADLLLFDAAVAIALAGAVWAVYELHDYQRALDDHQLKAAQAQQPLWAQAEAPDAPGQMPDLLVDSRFG